MVHTLGYYEVCVPNLRSLSYFILDLWRGYTNFQCHQTDRQTYQPIHRDCHVEVQLDRKKGREQMEKKSKHFGPGLILPYHSGHFVVLLLTFRLKISIVVLTVKDKKRPKLGAPSVLYKVVRRVIGTKCSDNLERRRTMKNMNTGFSLL